ncbi:MAG: polyamine aminopropyltransferase [Pseudomonadales bacterium]|nr:polyamine aminopropyltransferase [Pseudomonadales bacterium]
MKFDPGRRRLLGHDIVLITIMAILAGCGLIYEYLLSHYAGRILGVVESTIYIMIGLMIVSMGLGSFAAKALVNPFTSFAWLESIIALLGVTCILIIAAAVSVGVLLPRIIAETFNLPPDLMPEGGLIAAMQKLAYYTPYFFGALIGFLIGMEIPLIARVREAVYGEHLEHNTGTIYGADYIGAGLGAAVWVLLMLSIDITRAAVYTALANLLAGLVFLYLYRDRIARVGALFSMHGFVLAIALLVFKYGADWSANMSNLLFADEVIYAGASNYQHFTITERHIANRAEPLYGFFINGRLQFSSQDEHIYHAMLTYPAMMLAPDKARVLIIGGGDGLAVRDVLRFSPASITLIDLDAELVKLFTHSPAMPYFKRQLVTLNEQAFSDKRVQVVHGDAFVAVDALLAAGELFDAVIVDLPDPSHPDLNRLYSDHFYARLSQLLAFSGTMVVQSTSPYHAKDAFISIGKTIHSAGFNQVAQYRQNIPSFGEWGWSIASRERLPIRQRLARFDQLPVPHQWLTRDLLIAAFEFPANFFESKAEIAVNRLGSRQVYYYHDQAWREELGIYKD